MNKHLLSWITNLPEGFTLLELLISFAIVVILLMGAAQLILLSVNTKRTSDCVVESAELASKKLEYLKSNLFTSNELANETWVEWVKSQRGNEMFRREWRIEDVSGVVKKIEIECYAESCSHKNVRIVLFCSRELGF